MIKGDKGYSVLEFAVSSLISIPLVLLLVHSITASHALLIKARHNKERTVATVALYRAVERATADLDTHPFPLPPRNHKGNLTYYDGTPFRHRQTVSNTPGFTSTALRFYDVMRLNTSATETRGCMVFQARGKLLSTTPVRSVLLLGADGFFEALTNLETDSDPACYRVSLSIPAKSMITEIPSETQMYLARYAIPIRWIQTYIRDSEGTLRVLRHAGSQTYLNQPIAQHVPDFLVQTLANEDSSKYQMHLQTEQHQNLTFTHRIPRTNFRHILWSLQ